MLSLQEEIDKTKPNILENIQKLREKILKPEELP